MARGWSGERPDTYCVVENRFHLGGLLLLLFCPEAPTSCPVKGEGREGARAVWFLTFSGGDLRDGVQSRLFEYAETGVQRWRLSCLRLHKQVYSRHRPSNQNSGSQPRLLSPGPRRPRSAGRGVPRRPGGPRVPASGVTEHVCQSSADVALVRGMSPLCNLKKKHLQNCGGGKLSWGGGAEPRRAAGFLSLRKHGSGWWFSSAWNPLSAARPLGDGGGEGPGEGLTRSKAIY